jgi:hypothetical protein
MVLLAGALALGACDSWVTRPSFYNSVRVLAARRTGEPIAGVDLVLYTGQRPMGYGTTDSLGTFTFTNVPKGQYGIIASIPKGYDVIEHFVAAPLSTVRDNLNVAADTLSTVRFTYLKTGEGTLVARVVSTDGTPLTGVPVELYSPKGTIAKALIDSKGNATFTSVPIGV